MKIPLLFIVCMFSFCYSELLPSCCNCESHYSDHLLNLKCGIGPCKNTTAVPGMLCLSCVPKTLPSDLTSQDFSMGNLSSLTPTAICQDYILKGNDTLGRSIMSWESAPYERISLLYLIEVRSFIKIDHWNFVGMTNRTFADIKNLQLGLTYHFRISLFSPMKTSPVIFTWTPVFSPTIESPENITVSKYELKNKQLEAFITWNVPKDSSCSYRLFWISTSEANDIKQKVITRTNATAFACLTGLSFDTNYSVTILPIDSSNLRSVKSAVLHFKVPTCDELFGHNFSICAPGPPSNLTVSWPSLTNTTILSWSPPEYTSFVNHLSGYVIFILEIGSKFAAHSGTLHSQFFVEKIYTNITISNLKSDQEYVFEVRAISEGGTGSPFKLHWHRSALGQLQAASSRITYYYFIAPAAFLLAVLFVITYKICFNSSKQNKIYNPSGLADVDGSLRPFLISSDHIELCDVLGEGAFSKVHQGLFTRGKSKDEVAIKVFPAETIKRAQLLHEVEVMHLIGRHKNIVGLFGFALDVEKMYLVLEYCPLGNLRSYLLNLKPELMYMKSLPIVQRQHNIVDTNIGKRLCSYIYQVALGMDYISSLKLIHRDIAARNILMQNETQVKIADFGLSRDVYQDKFYLSQSQKKLPLKWMAPEAIEKQKFTTFTDVWSFGVFMWEVFKLGKEPYPGLRNSNVLQYLKMNFRLEKPHCSSEWYKIMKACWSLEPRQRPRFKDLVVKIGAIMDSFHHYTVLSLQ